MIAENKKVETVDEFLTRGGEIEKLPSQVWEPSQFMRLKEYGIQISPGGFYIPPLPQHE